MFKTIYRILLYLSFIFFAVYLYKIDYLVIKDTSFNYTLLVISTLILWCGFIVTGLSWWNALKIYTIKIKKVDAIYAHGISVFAKYIPGKIWVILGRAAQLKNYGHPLKLTSYISLKEQLTYLLLGLLISIIPVLIYFSFGKLIIVVLLTIVGLALILFSKRIHELMEKLFLKILKKELNIPFLKLREALKLSKYIIIYWIIWIIGFYIFIISIYPEGSFFYAFAFPISVVYGVLAIIVPGGIGVREGIMVLYLTLAGMPVEEATTLSVINRLWFISGEVFIFMFSISTKNRRVN